jgi:hypothetical protein
MLRAELADIPKPTAERLQRTNPTASLQVQQGENT